MVKRVIMVVMLKRKGDFMRFTVQSTALFLLFFICLSGCSDNAEQSKKPAGYLVQGRILEVKQDEILIANVIPRDTALDYTTKEILGSSDVQPIYVKIPDNQTYKKGQLVKAWLKKDKSVQYSVPAKGEAVEVHILKQP